MPHQWTPSWVQPGDAALLVVHLPPVKLLLQHHPERAYLLERTAHLDPIVVEDPEPLSGCNPWRTYKACLTVGTELREPFVIMQDDCVPVPGYAPAVERARELLPDALICLAVQGMLHQVARHRFWAAMEEDGCWLVEFTPVNWVSALAIAWTPELAREALDWDDRSRLPEAFNSDDARLHRFAKATRIPTWMTAPCLVEHPDDVPSVTGGLVKEPRAKRQAIAVYPGDASSITWQLNTLY